MLVTEFNEYNESLCVTLLTENIIIIIIIIIVIKLLFFTLQIIINFHIANYL